MGEGGFDAAFLAVGAHIGKRAYIPAGEAARILDAVSLLHGMEGEERPLLGRRVVGLRRRRHRDGRRPHRAAASEPTDAIVVYRRTRERMPAHDFEVQEALEEGVAMQWLSTIKHADAGPLTIERMELDETGFPQPTGELEELEADSLVLALGQEADLSLLDGVPGLRSTTASSRSTRHDDRPARHLRGRRHGARRAHGDRRDRSRQDGRAAHRRVAARGPRAADGDRARAGLVRPAQHLVLRRRAAHRARPQLELARRASTFDEVVGGLDEPRPPCSRRGAACRAATASRATTATACAPTTRCSSSAAGAPLRDRLRLLQGLRDLRRRSAPAGRSRCSRRRSERTVRVAALRLS